MSWEWVTLLLGIVILVVALFAFMAWLQLLQTRARMGSLAQKKEEDAGN